MSDVTIPGGKIRSFVERVENIDGEDDAAVLSAYLARTYVTSDERASELLGRPVEELGLVVAHLGGGCSVTAGAMVALAFFASA